MYPFYRHSALDLFDGFLRPYKSPSVYVISDSQLAEYKQAQLKQEIAELDRLIDSHKQSIERLEETKIKLTQDVQRTSLSSSEQSSLPEPEHSEQKTGS